MRIEKNIEREEIAMEAIYGDCLWRDDLSGNLYTDIHALVLSSEEHERIVSAQNSIVSLLHKVQRILSVDPALNEWLGIPENLYSLANKKAINTLTTYGRFDWMFGKNGELNLLEFNSETPMGWKESALWTLKAHQYFAGTKCHNTRILTLLEDSVRETISQLGHLGRGTVAIVGDLSDQEEIDTFELLASVTKMVNPNVVLCSAADLKLLRGYTDVADGVYIEVEKGELLKIDVLQTFYSVEWMAGDDGGQDLIDFIESGLVGLMNPVSTLQIHSKGVFALIWFLLSETELLKEYEQIIWDYIPYSTFDSSEFKNIEHDKYVAKPLNHREGDGIVFKNADVIMDEDYTVYQEFVDSVCLIHQRRKEGGERVFVEMYPTIGTYCIGDKFAGYMSRVSETVCSAFDSTFLPTFVE